jgi:DNA-binding HxlR family transcriptional regulator
MVARDNISVRQLFVLLEARYALRILWALRDGHAQTFRVLQDSVGGVTPNTLNTRLKALRQAGLLVHGGEGYCVTLMGADLLRRIGELPTFAGRWARGPRRRK